MSEKPISVRIGRKQNEKDRAFLAREKAVEIRTAGEDKPRATSYDPCMRCGVPGFRGCAHQRPYLNDTPNPAAEKRGRRSRYTPGKY